MNSSINKTRVSKKQKKLLSIMGVLIALIGWWAYTNFMSHPLGDKLEYLGKVDSGCLFVCDARPGSTYYYGTDMSIEELKSYFKKAQHNTVIQDGGGISMNYSFKNVHFNSTSGDFIFSYYNNSDAVINSKHLNKSGKRNVISLSDFDYSLARDALK